MFSLFSTILFWLRLGFNRVKNFLGLPITGYKITDENDRTYNKCQWGPGVTHVANGDRNLCGPGWLHYYETPLLAAFHSPLHMDLNPEYAHLWKCKIRGKIKREGQLKSGCTELTTLKRVKLPVLSHEQRVRYAILCGQRCSRETPSPAWNRWAKDWLSGNDRVPDNARVMAYRVDTRGLRGMFWAAMSAGRLEDKHWISASDAAFTAYDTFKLVGELNLHRFARKATG